MLQSATIDLINTILISAGIGICGMCLLHIATSTNLNSVIRRYFLLFFPVLLLNMSMHLARQIMNGLPGAGVRSAMIAAPFIEGNAACVMTYLMSLLIVSLSALEPENKKRTETLLHILMAAHFVIMIYGTVTGSTYYIDADNMYNRGNAYLLGSIIPVLMLVNDLVILIRCGGKLDHRIKLAFYVYIVTPTIAVLIQSRSYGIQYIIIATVASSVYMYFVLIKGQSDQYRQQIESISRMQNGLILVLADLVESRDQCTGDHIRKTAEYTRIIMTQMRKDGFYKDQLTDAFIEDVVRSAPLHDLGKIRVPDAILNKPGKLTDEEFEAIKEHTTAGGDIIGRAIDMVSDSDSGYLTEARNLAYYHHEKWNGKGYPQKLSGEDIPLSARIMAVADVFDALVSKRSYKEPFSIEQAIAIIKEGSGEHFDPKIVTAFLHAEDEIRMIAKQNAEG